MYEFNIIYIYTHTHNTSMHIYMSESSYYLEAVLATLF